jgi:hypothetical protein
MPIKWNFGHIGVEITKRKPYNETKVFPKRKPNFLFGNKRF